MRLFTVLITCSMLIACGKTGALFLPEEPQEPAEQNAQPQNRDASSGEKAD